MTITNIFALYFPVAEVHISALLVVIIGFASGFASGLLGVGGGFISTPLLTLMGVSPSVAIATSAHQIVGTSFSGILPRIKPKKVDFKLGFILAFSGSFGIYTGVLVFDFFTKLGSIDAVISICYVFLMTFISFISFKKYFTKTKKANTSHNQGRKLNIFITKFNVANVECSILTPMILGIVSGVLVMMMGMGGGFILVPAMISIMKVENDIAIGTSLLQILLITTVVVFFHIFKTGLLDVLLGMLLILGSAVGSQISSIVSLKIGKTKVIHLILALLTLTIGVHFALELFVFSSEDKILIQEIL